MMVRCGRSGPRCTLAEPFGFGIIRFVLGSKIVRGECWRELTRRFIAWDGAWLR